MIAALHTDTIPSVGVTRTCIVGSKDTNLKNLNVVFKCDMRRDGRKN